MAKLKGPLFSLDAHGSLGRALTFSSKRSGSQVRFQKRPLDVHSETQLQQRAYFGIAMGWWSILKESEKEEWLRLGSLA